MTGESIRVGYMNVWRGESIKVSLTFLKQREAFKGGKGRRPLLGMAGIGWFLH